MTLFEPAFTEASFDQAAQGSDGRIPVKKRMIGPCARAVKGGGTRSRQRSRFAAEMEKVCSSTRFDPLWLERDRREYLRAQIGATRSDSAFHRRVQVSDIDRGNKASGASLILVRAQYKYLGCNPDKRPGTRKMEPDSDGDSRDSVRDKRLCSAVYLSVRPPRRQRRERRRVQ